jgi:signal transduction histidine kinase
MKRTSPPNKRSLPRRPPRAASVTDLRQLAAAAAHEIRNPLNTMAIHCEILESRLNKLDLSAREREALMRSVGVLSGEVQRIDRILDHFLVHAGPEEADREPVDAEPWIAEVVARARTLAERAGVTIALEHPRLGRWSIDQGSLSRAMLLVLENAIEASSRGAAITVTASADRERALIRISDPGRGIPREQLANVCHVGFTTKPGHAGLGLAIAKQVVKAQHGGELVIESTPGRGTCVTMSIPLEDEI